MKCLSRFQASLLRLHRRLPCVTEEVKGSACGVSAVVHRLDKKQNKPEWSGEGWSEIKRFKASFAHEYLMPIREDGYWSPVRSSRCRRESTLSASGHISTVSHVKAPTHATPEQTVAAFPLQLRFYFFFFYLDQKYSVPISVRAWCYIFRVFFKIGFLNLLLCFCAIRGLMELHVLAVCLCFLLSVQLILRSKTGSSFHVCRYWARVGLGPGTLPASHLGLRSAQRLWPGPKR